MTRRNYPPCVDCGRPLPAGQRNLRHHACTPGDLSGETCTCPPGCTNTNIGDNGTCADDCIPCPVTAGNPYPPPNTNWGHRRTPART